MPFYTHDNVPDSPINNFATLNPLDVSLLTNGRVLENGNLKATQANSATLASIGMSRIDNIYFECFLHRLYSNVWGAGVWLNDNNNQRLLGFFLAPSKIAFYNSSLSELSSTATSAHSTSSVYAYHITKDSTGISVSIYRDGTLQASESFTSYKNASFLGLSLYGNGNNTSDSTIISYNFGQDPTFGGAKSPTTTYPDANGIGQFHYEPPAGALALCTKNLPEGPIKLSQDQTPSDHFKAVTWTGNGTSQSITGVGFQPDLNWIKGRSSADYHVLHDSLRGANKRLFSNTTGAETTASTMTSFDSDGFSVSTGGSYTSTNANETTYVAWCWKAAGAPADGGSSVAGSARIINEDGTQADTTCAALASAAGASITPSKVSANRQNGFSIVSYRGTLTTGSGQTVSHGLTTTPDLIIIKNTTRGSTNFMAWSSAYGTNQTLQLNTVGTLIDAQPKRFGGASSSTFSVGYFYDTGYRYDEYIAYCWHSVAGYSKFGSFTGNGSADGPMVYCGFRPAFVMVKRTDGTGSWVIHDSARDPHNEVEGVLNADASTEEKTHLTTGVDFLSNGFKLRGNSTWYGNNSSTQTAVFMAFAEQPFSGPANAR